MSDHPNNQELRELVETLGLTHQETANIALTSKRTIEAYFYDPESPSYRVVPDRVLSLVRLQMGLQKPGYRRLGREYKQGA